MNSLFAEQEICFSNIIENLNEGIFYIDNQMIVRYVNKAITRIFGYEPEELVGRHIFHLPNYEIYAENLNTKIQRCQSALPEAYEMEALTKSGSKIWISVNSSPVINGNSEFEGSFSIISDITERKKQERDLWLFRELINQSNDMLLLICPDSGYLIYTNCVTSQTLGYSRGDISQMKITDISVNSHNAELWREHINILRAQKKMILECKYRKKDGSTFPVEVSTRLINIDKLEFIVAIARDMTKRKEIENKLKTALEDRNKLLSSMQEAFFSVDMTTGKPLILSHAHEDIYGYSLEEMLDNPQLWFEAIHPDDKKMIEKKMQLFSRGITTHDQHRVIRKDGKTIWVEGKVVPTLDPDGKLIRIDGVVSDISKRKKEEQLKNEKINDLNTFIYKTTHDLKSPLSSLGGLIKLAEKRTGQESLGTYFKLMEQSVEKMQGMLNDLTTIIETPHKELNQETIDLKNIIEDIIAETRHLPEMEKIFFSAEIDQQSIFHTDKKLLMTILRNLVMNSIKYRSSVDPYVKIQVKEDQKGVKIIVRDNGIGIAENMQGKIFDMFFRGTVMSTGTGLGLYIVKTTVQKLHGKITVHSKEGKGAAFTVYLPDLKKYFIKHGFNKKEEKQ